MPRDVENVVVIQIEGEDIEIRPIRGAKNASVVFELMSLASRMVYAASQANINLVELFRDIDSEENTFGFFQNIRGENFLVFDFVANELLKRWEHLLVKVFPVLLGKDPQWLADHGTPFEYFAALWSALRLNAPHIFGEKNWASVKNLLSAQAEEGQGEQPEETSEETS